MGRKCFNLLLGVGLLPILILVAGARRARIRGILHRLLTRLIVAIFYFKEKLKLCCYLVQCTYFVLILNTKMPRV